MSSFFKSLPEFFNDLPSALAETAQSEDTASQIAEICQNNGVEEEKTIEEVAYMTAVVLLGGLPPKTLPKAMGKNLKIDEATASAISSEVNESIFAPLKDELNKIYQEQAPQKEKEAPPAEKKPKEPRENKKPDTYRESVE